MKTGRFSECLNSKQNKTIIVQIFFPVIKQGLIDISVQSCQEQIINS